MTFLAITPGRHLSRRARSRWLSPKRNPKKPGISVSPFTNGDIGNHGATAASLEPRTCFNVTTPQGVSRTRRVVASNYPVAIGRPIHAAMSAWVYVLHHPYHAIIDAADLFRLPSAPPGRYPLQLRHTDGGLRREGEIVARGREPVRLRLEFHDGDLRIEDRQGR